MKKLMLIGNILMLAVLAAATFYHESTGFAFATKCLCSSIFTVHGLGNLCYALLTKRGNLKFTLAMGAGVVFAFLGDVLINFQFLLGAGAFAIGHIFFLVAYCFLQRLHRRDFLFGALPALGTVLFLLFAPGLVFGVKIYQIACVLYAFIISLMLGKAIGNFWVKRNTATAVMALGSALFFFSDLMLTFHLFLRSGDWANAACLSTYYPAMGLMALSIFLQAEERKSA